MYKHMIPIMATVRKWQGKICIAFLFRVSLVCSNDDPGVTLTYFTARSNFVTFYSVGKSKKVDFSETFAACDLK